MLKKIKQYQFLFEELVKRDFKKKYNGTLLGVLLGNDYLCGEFLVEIK